jgi:hypothetical protein
MRICSNSPNNSSSIIQSLCFSLILFLASCATHATLWTKIGFNSTQWAKDDSNCSREAAQAFPAQFVTDTSQGYTTPINTDCTNIGRIINCTTTGGKYYPITVTKDLNAGNRAHTWEKCIRSHGYFPEDELPNPIKEAFTEAKTASELLCKRTEYEAFYKKSACKEEDLSLEQMSDKSKATTEDKTIISKLREEEKYIVNKLTSNMSNFGSKTDANIALLIRNYSNYADQNYLKLFEGNITFGEFNKKRQEIEIQFKLDLDKLTLSQ